MKKTIIKSNMGRLVSDSHRYETQKGEISLLHPCKATFQTYEIYSIKGNLFDHIERYNSLEAAEKRIDYLLIGCENTHVEVKKSADIISDKKS